MGGANHPHKPRVRTLQVGGDGMQSTSNVQGQGADAVFGNAYFSSSDDLQQPPFDPSLLLPRLQPERYRTACLSFQGERKLSQRA